MIKVNKGKVSVKGNKATIYAEIICLFEAMRGIPSMDVDVIVTDALRDSKLSDEEVSEQIEELKKKIRKVDDIHSLFCELIQEMQKEE